MTGNAINREDLANLERQVDNLTKLVYINGIINSTLDIGKLLTIIMEIIKDIMETEASTLLLYDDIEGNLVFRVALGESGRELVEKYRVSMGQGVAAARVRDHAYHCYPRDGIGRAIRTERYRLVEWKISGKPPETAEIELYDYQQDPLETKNHARDKPEIVAELRAILAKHPEAKPR